MLGSWYGTIRNFLYDQGVLPAYRSPAFVISVGNLTWGGTGKTALIGRLAAHLSGVPFRVAVVSRGYGRKSGDVLLVNDGGRLVSKWEGAGDEPYMLAKQFPDIPVVVSGNRKKALQMLETFHPDVILLDDAFQHRKVCRDLDLVLLDTSENLLKQKVIPFGKLREGRKSLERADALILTHISRAVPETLEWIRTNIRVPTFSADYEAIRPNEIRGKEVVAFCGIGAPRHFRELLEDCGAKIVYSAEFRDHHAYTAQELEDLQRKAEQLTADLVVTTRKDAVRIGDYMFRVPLHIVDADLKLQNEEPFFQYVLDCILHAQREREPSVG